MHLFLSKFGLSVVAMLLGLGCAEGLLRAVTALSPDLDAALHAPPSPVIADDLLGWKGTPGYRTHDADGFRNRTVATAADVVTFGDSQTYGYKLAREKAWPHQLGDLRRLQVYNMAFPGWGPGQGYLLLDRALGLQPRTVVQAIYTGNDLVDTFALTYGRDVLQEFRSTRPEVVAALADAERQEPWAANADIQSVLPQGDWAPPSSSSALIEGLELTRLLGAAGRTVDELLADDSPGGEEVAFNAGRLKTVFVPSRRLAAVNLDDPRVAEGLRIALALLGQMDDAARARGAAFMVVLIPTKEYAFRDAVAKKGRLGSPAYDRLVRTERAVIESIRQHLDARGIAFVDATPPLRRAIAAGRNPYFATSNGHLEDAGQRLVAEAVEDWLEAAPGDDGRPGPRSDRR